MLEVRCAQWAANRAEPICTFSIFHYFAHSQVNTKAWKGLYKPFWTLLWGPAPRKIIDQWKRTIVAIADICIEPYFIWIQFSFYVQSCCYQSSSLYLFSSRVISPNGTETWDWMLGNEMSTVLIIQIVSKHFAPTKFYSLNVIAYLISWNHSSDMTLLKSEFLMDILVFYSSLSTTIRTSDDAGLTFIHLWKSLTLIDFPLFSSSLHVQYWIGWCEDLFLGENVVWSFFLLSGSIPQRPFVTTKNVSRMNSKAPKDRFYDVPYCQQFQLDCRPNFQYVSLWLTKDFTMVTASSTSFTRPEVLESLFDTAILNGFWQYRCQFGMKKHDIRLKRPFASAAGTSSTGNYTTRWNGYLLVQKRSYWDTGIDS